MQKPMRSRKKVAASGTASVPAPAASWLILPASSGVEEMAALQDEQKAALFSHLEDFGPRLDYLLIDTGAGVNSNVTYFNQSAQESIVVVHQATS